MSEIETKTTDVLVIGGEGAALRAAIEAHDKGARTIIACKGRIGKSGSTMIAGADISLDGNGASKIGLPGNEEDNKTKFSHDILVQGYYLNNQKLVEAYVRDAPLRTKELIDWGMKHRWDGKRAVLSQGVEIDRVMVEQVKKRAIEVIEDICIIDFLTDGKTVIGAFGIDVNRGNFLVFRAKSVVIGTGGWQRGYSFTSAPRGLTGDMHAAALRAGADLLNMEMVTFCPNVLLWPPALRGDIFPYILIEMFGELLDKHGHPFLKDYDQRIYKIATTTEWNKLIFCLASTRVIQSGNGSPRGGVYYSLKTIPWNIVEEGEKIYPGWKWIRTDYSDLMDWLKQGNAIEVAAAAHYMEGGIRVDENARTTLKGLYAAGECSGGLFGANRVASAITQIIVQGAIAGASAASQASKTTLLEPNKEEIRVIQARLTAPFERKNRVSPIELKKKMRMIADEKLWVIRHGKGLQSAVEELRSIATNELPKLSVQTGTRTYNKEWIDAIQVQNLAIVLEASARSGLMRKESRGVHYRSDYPKTDNDNWLREIIVRQANGRFSLSTRPVTVTKFKLPHGKFSFEEGIIRAVERLGE